MSITAEKIDYIVKVGIHPILKREGFLKSARTFRRGRANCIQIINLQGSWTNYRDQGLFTVNLAVYFPEAAKLLGTFRITDRPSESDCIVRQRIGHLMSVKRDYWWQFDDQSNLDKIAQEVVSACLQYGIPWLEEHSTVKGATQFALSRNTPYWVAIFSLMQENRENAKKYLVEAMEKASPNPQFRSRLEDWGRANGLIS